MSAPALFSMLFVLTCALSGIGLAATLYERNHTMALYEVKRVDDVQPGEFDSAMVIAGGTALAREAVAHMLPKGAKVTAEKVDTTRRNATPVVLSAYWDEREPVGEASGGTEPLFDV